MKGKRYSDDSSKGERGLRGEWNIIVKGKEDVDRMASQLDSVWERGGSKQ